MGALIMLHLLCFAVRSAGISQNTVLPQRALQSAIRTQKHFSRHLLKLVSCCRFAHPKNGSLSKASTYYTMVLDSILSSPVRKSASFRKQFSQNELGSWSTLFQRHRFLLTALALLTFLCTVYLYFAVTLGASPTCSGLSGTQKALCRLEHAKTSVAHGKLKIL
ncbi:hypothetical protein Prudu_008886 [Prunus dulcis]|uniref:Uncharacterized protein n=1 Tax=Prunus dulcis TaxID=3755 RepID=A0A4Y1R522_PRUDU|nr:hypothetical protein Prudu_008886 [Prunus dulcis]